MKQAVCMYNFFHHPQENNWADSIYRTAVEISTGDKIRLIDMQLNSISCDMLPIPQEICSKNQTFYSVRGQFFPCHSIPFVNITLRKYLVCRWMEKK